MSFGKLSSTFAGGSRYYIQLVWIVLVHCCFECELRATPLWSMLLLALKGDQAWMQLPKSGCNSTFSVLGYKATILFDPKFIMWIQVVPKLAMWFKISIHTYIYIYISEFIFRGVVFVGPQHVYVWVFIQLQIIQFLCEICENARKNKPPPSSWGNITGFRNHA